LKKAQFSTLSFITFHLLQFYTAASGISILHLRRGFSKNSTKSKRNFVVRFIFQRSCWFLKKLPDQLFSRETFGPLETLDYYVFVVRLPLAVWSHKRVSFQICLPDLKLFSLGDCDADCGRAVTHTHTHSQVNWSRQRQLHDQHEAKKKRTKNKS